jgi:sec-independent protein translocase protein TatA
VFRQIGPTEIIIILAVVILLFGGKKLPELARGSGRALRIFKAETKGLMDDDDESESTPKPIEAREVEASPTQATGTQVEGEPQAKPTD